MYSTVAVTIQIFLELCETRLDLILELCSNIDKEHNGGGGGAGGGSNDGLHSTGDLHRVEYFQGGAVCLVF